MGTSFGSSTRTLMAWGNMEMEDEAQTMARGKSGGGIEMERRDTRNES